MSRLVLTRKTEQGFVIYTGDEVLANIKVCKISKNQVRLVITADQNIKIDREEKYLLDKN